ncbi:MAG: hypothetical protein AAGA90_15450 [Actinomycetota bacterium]
MDEWSELDAPADVVDTIDWLLRAGFVVERRLMRDQPNGNKLVGLRRDDEAVTIVRDRGVWELAVRGEDWVAGLHTLHEAVTGEVFEHVPGARLPQQHPSDELSWMDAVPGFFTWRDHTGDWRSKVSAAEAAGAERIRRRSGSPPQPPDHR